LRAIPYHADVKLKTISPSNPQTHGLQELAGVVKDLEASTRYLQTDNNTECNLASVRWLYGILIDKYGSLID
jgi:hypothetical protein